jgi:hypothetical protein
LLAAKIGPRRASSAQHLSTIAGNYNNASSARNSATEDNDPNIDPCEPNRERRLTGHTHIASVLGLSRFFWRHFFSNSCDQYSPFAV